MKVLKVILIIIAVLAAIFLAGGLFLPKTYSVTRSAVIKAPDSVLAEHCSDYNKFMKWNPWYKMEPTAKIEISGTASQPGHLYKWTGDKTGKGEMLITKVETPRLIESKLTFIEPFPGEADNSFTLAPTANATTITWTISGKNNSMAEKWMALPMNYFIGKDFESGLNSLKEITETK